MAHLHVKVMLCRKCFMLMRDGFFVTLETPEEVMLFGSCVGLSTGLLTKYVGLQIIV